MCMDDLTCGACQQWTAVKEELLLVNA
ncbi:hypothetical protein CCACVL1_05343 [Corchorus capsularis]|uniref:Uncharacterized protein n=1 Tax=Corchorus capsularis TaxID=210143 RepID=A0A1R3JL66_COCAP|nr:hypothetical protein CCACVL1_05343 [Corchorus capsularis]